jgi:hypothetical protein
MLRGISFPEVRQKLKVQWPHETYFSARREADGVKLENHAPYIRE